MGDDLHITADAKDDGGPAQERAAFAPATRAAPGPRRGGCCSPCGGGVDAEFDGD